MVVALPRVVRRWGLRNAKPSIMLSDVVEPRQAIRGEGVNPGTKAITPPVSAATEENSAMDPVGYFTAGSTGSCSPARHNRGPSRLHRLRQSPLLQWGGS